MRSRLGFRPPFALPLSVDNAPNAQGACAPVTSLGYKATQAPRLHSP